MAPVAPIGSKTGPALPPAAYERAREIAGSAPAISDAKRARLQLIAWGAQSAPDVAPDPAEAA
jgi:hypothetical protein